MTRYAETLRLLATLPAPQAFAGIQRERITVYSAEIGIPFPPSLLEWLIHANGASVESQYLVGIDGTLPTDMPSLYTLHPNWKAAGLIPVASDGCGNHYVIATRQEYGKGCPVLFIDHERNADIPDFLVASDFSIFVSEFVRREANGSNGWPFDPQSTLRIDPNLASFSGAPLPWSN
ncbi:MULTISPECIES: SMI1/KNR4 family protein [Deinococcus]|uniref:SMI1/KNR4 family protein n=1 Tax=Deinococcus rufus TaxID=2136097 RepID=A0ABV7ZCK4_9DEIO|nr:SMI1/KNR4 family protein [Deinococcus sp. AB2017081]WQE95606.1 SMI1/KNR4 family protein [Deinococcus sp. AB2017081]